MKAIELRVELPPDNRTSLERKDLRALASALDGYAKVTPLQRTRIREVDGGGPTGGMELIGIVVLMAPSALAFPFRSHSAAAQPRAAAAAPKCVLTNALVARPPAASALPALKPNHPTHSRQAPTKLKTTLCGGIGSLG